MESKKNRVETTGASDSAATLAQGGSPQDGYWETEVRRCLAVSPQFLRTDKALLTQPRDLSGRGQVSSIELLSAFCGFTFRMLGEREIVIAVAPSCSVPLGPRSFPVFVQLDEGETFNSLKAKLSEKWKRIEQSLPMNEGGLCAGHGLGQEAWREHAHGHLSFAGTAVPGAPEDAQWRGATLLAELQGEGLSSLRSDMDLEHLIVFLDGARSHLSGNLEDLPVMDACESALLARWSGMGRARATSELASLPAIFDEVAERRADCAALRFEGSAMTYRELQARSRALASRVVEYQRTSRASGDVIAVCMERGTDAIVAFLAILRAGCSFVPVRPSDPADYVAAILEDSGAGLILTERSTHSRCSQFADAGLDVLLVDDGLDGGADATPETRLGGDSIAYRMYTSGSTGAPKGVCVSHRAVAALLHQPDFVAIGKDDCVLHASDLGFDASIFEIWGGLLNGACVAIVSRDALLSEESLLQELSHSRANIAFFTTSYFNLLVANDSAVCSQLETIVIGGEKANPETVTRFLENEKSSATLINGYGPTETCVFATAYQVSAKDAHAEAIPIGKPVGGRSVYVLNESLLEVPIGCVGELCIGGSGVAEGYLGDEALTQERFRWRTNPRGERERLFLTNDLARFRSDGDLEFVRRRGTLSKIRGFRVDAFEVERAVSAHPRITQSAVVEIDLNSEKRLAAFFVTDPGSTVTDDELRGFLASKVPDYMLPSVLIEIDAIPMKGNGKRDVAALMKLQRPSAPEGHLDEPLSEMESTLAGIFAELLATPQAELFRSSDFFGLGGHSLLMTQAIMDVHQAFQVSVTVREFLGNSQIGALARLIEGKQSAGSASPPRGSGATPETASLSDFQAQIWFSEALEPGVPTYNILFAYSLEGPFDVPAFEVAVNGVLRRHPLLRATVEAKDGKPQLRIAPGRALRLCVTDQSPDGLMACVDAEVHAPFKLSEGPLIRVRVFRLSEDKHAVTITQHHIVSDEWSVQILFNEISEAYSARVSGREPCALQPPGDYNEWVRWQRGFDGTPEYREQVAFWKDALASMASHHFPTDAPRTHVQETSNGAHLRSAITKVPTEALKSLARRENTTLFVVLQAILKLLVFEETGESDVSVGVPVTRRERVHARNTVGYFLNILVLRDTLRKEHEFTELLRAVKATTARAFSNADVPFIRLVEELRSGGLKSGNPFFQIMLVVQREDELPQLQFEGLTVTPIRLEHKISRFAMTWFLTEKEEELLLDVEYSASLFREETIARLVSRFVQLTERIASGERSVSSSAPCRLSPDAFLQGLSGPGTLPQTGSVLDTVGEAAGKFPDAVAAECGDQQLTFGSLVAGAREGAEALRSWCDNPGFFAGLLIERGTEYLKTMLAVWEAGGYFVPLDPRGPIASLRRVAPQPDFIITDSRNRNLAEQLVGGDKVFVLGQGKPQVRTVNGPSALQSDIAYVMYTSGSTGKPKGALVNHVGMMNHLLAKVDALKLTRADRVAQTARQTFDVSIWQYLAGALVGAATVVFPDEQAWDPPQLLAELESKKVTVFETVPSHLVEMVRYMEARPGRFPLPHLRWLIMNGELFPASLFQRWRAVHPASAVMNAYGPTECSDDVTHFVLSPEDELTSRSVPIGKPIRNVELAIVDDNGEPVAANQRGELFVGGIAVGDGYLADEDETKARFIGDNGPSGTGRVYRTGDIVRCLPDGNLEFIGRKDEQVKLHGVRIELGAIEVELRKVDGVKDAVAQLVQAASEPKLVAYLLLEPGAVLTHQGLREALAAGLRPQEIPTEFMSVQAFPRMASGKIDKKRLRSLEGESIGGVGEGCQPRDRLEFRLQQCWSAVLGKEYIEVEEDFFTYGGSLMALQLLAEINEAFQTEHSVAWIFVNSTIQLQAESIRDPNSKGSFSPILRLSDADVSHPAVYMVHPGGGGAAAYLKMAQLLKDRQVCLTAIESQNLYGADEPLTTVEAMARAYLANLDLEKPIWLGGWSFGGVIAFEMAQQLKKMGKRVEALLLLDTYTLTREEKATLLYCGRSVLNVLDRNGFFMQMPEQYRAALIRVFDIESQAMAAYEPRPYDGKTIIFKATGGENLALDPSCKKERILAELLGSVLSRAGNGWSGLIENLEVRPMSCHHQELMRERLSDVVDSISQNCRPSEPA